MARHRRNRRRHPRWRGLGFRALSVLLGVVIGGGLVVVTVLSPGRVHLRVVIPHHFTVVPLAATSTPRWPLSGGAAVAVQSRDGGGTVVQNGPVQTEAPIASVTKMMTAYVAVRYLPPLTATSGPCLVVTAADVAEYHADAASDQSNVRVAAGEQLCAFQLLAGLLVHSGNNYATLLARLTTTSLGGAHFDFLAAMNTEAAALGMAHTHYVDYSGYLPGSRSTAADQLRLALKVMVVPLLRHVVGLTAFRLPVAGVVTTYTPLLGTNGVVGIKSGRTGYAGGCDVMALEATRAGHSFLVYAVVTNQYGGDVLANAGAAAYRLAQSVLPSISSYRWPEGRRDGRLVWSGQVLPLAVRNVHPLEWWGRTPPRVRFVRVHVPASAVRKGQVVAMIERASDHVVLAEVVTTKASTPIPWWHRLR